MLVNCQICGNKIDRKNAFCVEHQSKSGNIKKKYYCNSIEYEIYEEEKEKQKIIREKITDSINYILGYECLNHNLIRKEMKELVNTYTFEEILNCFQANKNNIRDNLDLKGIDKEFNKIRYMFIAIKSNIYEDTQNYKELNKEPIKRIKSEDITYDEIPFSDYKYIEKESIDFSGLF